MIATNSMRRFSQKVFEAFKRAYIDSQRNFFLEADQVTEAEILGEGGRDILEGVNDLEVQLQRSRSGIKSFVIYQLVNDRGGNGEGVGCGRYDEVGTLDAGGIRKAMTQYILGFCFDPRRGIAHARAFADYCLRSLPEEPFVFVEPGDIEGTQKAVTRLLGQEAMTSFWLTSGDQIKQLLSSAKGTVHCYNNFSATYEDRLPTLFLALDRLVSAVSSPPPQ